MDTTLAAPPRCSPLPDASEPAAGGATAAGALLPWLRLPEGLWGIAGATAGEAGLTGAAVGAEETAG